jgi:ribose transport system substrate-binding protein
VVSHDGTLAALQQLKAGNYVAAEFGYNLDALAWYGADQVLRMMTGAPAVQNEQFPFRRLFDKGNVGELDLTGGGQSSGTWYGSADYRAGFIQLWGLTG